jgi:hypothetical protein
MKQTQIVFLVFFHRDGWYVAIAPYTCIRHTFYDTYCFATENIGEAQAVRRLLRTAADVRPPVTVLTFQWSETNQYPNLPAVMKTPFWSDPGYEPLRARLLRPEKKVELQEGGHFLTLRTDESIRNDEGGVVEVSFLLAAVCCHIVNKNAVNRGGAGKQGRACTQAHTRLTSLAWAIVGQCTDAR